MLLIVFATIFVEIILEDLCPRITMSPDDIYLASWIATYILAFWFQLLGSEIEEKYSKFYSLANSSICYCVTFFISSISFTLCIDVLLLSCLFLFCVYYQKRTPIIFISGFNYFKDFAAPSIVPGLLISQMKWVIFPYVFLYIYGPVLL